MGDTNAIDELAERATKHALGEENGKHGKRDIGIAESMRADWGEYPRPAQAYGVRFPRGIGARELNDCRERNHFMPRKTNAGRVRAYPHDAGKRAMHSGNSRPAY